MPGADNMASLQFTANKQLSQMARLYGNHLQKYPSYSQKGMREKRGRVEEMEEEAAESSEEVKRGGVGGCSYEGGGG